MRQTRFALTLLALVAAQAGAQTAPAVAAPAAQAASAPAAAPGAFTTMPAAWAGAPVAPAAAPAASASAAAPAAAPAAPAAPAAVPAASAPARSASAAASDEPRIIRGTDQVIAPQPAAPALTGPATSFKFEDAPVREVVHVILGDLIKADYIMHPPVDGRITLVTQAGVTPDTAMFLLETALQANGLLMVRDVRGTYHVGRPDALKAIVAAPRLAGAGPLPPGQGAIVVPLRYIGAAEMATILRPMVPAEAILRVDSVRNLLVLAGTRTQAEGWLSMVQTFDVDLLKGMSVGLFPLKYASVREVEAAIQLMSAGGTRSGAGAPTAPSAMAAAGAAGSAAGSVGDAYPLFGAVRILPIERLNAVLVVTPRAAYLDDARRWIEQMDRPGNNGKEERLFVYPVRNGSAQHLAAVLNGIFGDDSRKTSSPTSGVAPGQTVAAGATTPATASVQASSMQQGSSLLQGSAGGQAGAGARQQSGPTVSTVQLAGNLRVVADDLNNAILIYGSAAQYEKIEDALKRLDVAPTQVLIEASIIEVSLTDDLKYGLQWAFSDNQSNGKVGTSVLSSLAGGVLGGQTAGFSYTLRNSLGNVRAVLNALADKSLVRVISSPSLMVLDNHTASIVVGNQQPIRTSETINTNNGNNLSTSYQYKDTGVALSVMPSVNAGDMVTLQISQAVTDVGAPDQVTQQRAFLQRQINSKVAVRTGETLVLGGLIRDNDTSGSSGVPGLHEIPLFGALFGTKSREASRTELLVIITPRVVRSDQDARDVSRELRERMRGFGPAMLPPSDAPARPATTR